MSLYAALTDGTTTVYLRRCTAGDPLVGRPDGYRQKTARRLANGRYEQVTETWELVFTESSDADRADTLLDLGNLRDKAWRRRHYRRLGDWVWLQVQTATETSARYAVVDDLFIPELDGRHYRSNARPDLRMEITREGVWREQAPNASWPTAVVSGTLYNKYDASNVNVMSVNNTAVVGDAPALARVIIEPNSSLDDYNTYILAIKQRYGALPALQMHFNAVDDTSAGAWHGVDANAPGGYRIAVPSMAGLTSLEMAWDFPTGVDLDDYRGEYLAYAVVQPATNPTLQLRLRQKVGTLVELTKAVKINYSVASGNYVAAPLGRITLPPKELIPGIAQSSGSDLEFSLLAEWTSSQDFYFRNIYLVPIDDGICGVHKAVLDTGGMKVHLDGNLREIYVLDSGDDQLITPMKLLGDYITITPGMYTAFYLYATKTNRSYADAYVTAGDNFDVTVNVVERYTTLRD